MSQKRSKDQIIAQILSLCREDGAGKTRIVYQANLNFHTVKMHLGLLLKNGLLDEFLGEQTIYKTTAKGEQALEHLREVEAIYS
jgi:predicted transcriptional regulator